MKKLLLADDSPTIERMVRLNFEGEEIEIICARDGDRAVSLFKSDKPDIVLADIYMPGQNGFNVCHFIKTQSGSASVPVLLLVGSFEPFNEEEAERVKADGVLVKPLDSNQLVETVKKLLQKGATSLNGEVFVKPEREEILEVINIDDWDLPEERRSSPPTPMNSSVAPVTDDSGSKLPPVTSSVSANAEETSFLEIGTISLVRSAEVPAPEVPAPAEDLLLELPDWELREKTITSGEEVPVQDLQKDSLPLDVGNYPITNQGERSEEPPQGEVTPSYVHAVANTEGSSVPPQTSGAPPDYQLSEEDIERIAQRVVTRLSDHVLREIAWEIIPDLATMILREEAYKRPELLH